VNPDSKRNASSKGASIAPLDSNRKRLFHRLRADAPPVGFAVLLLSSLLVRCATRDDSALTSAGVHQTGELGEGGAGGSPILVGGGGRWSPLEAGPPPCTPTTADRDCPIPRPQCDGDSALAYYANPACVERACQWTRRTAPCAHGCADGGCSSPATSELDGSTDGDPECSSGDGSVCAVPPSICMDDSHVLYFTNPSCVAGRCQSEAHTLDCTAHRCERGGCRYAITTH
jgi:hypothetical protein